MTCHGAGGGAWFSPGSSTSVSARSVTSAATTTGIIRFASVMLAPSWRSELSTNCAVGTSAASRRSTSVCRCDADFGPGPRAQPRRRFSATASPAASSVAPKP
jgi:hypothetical protein